MTSAPEERAATRSQTRKMTADDAETAAALSNDEGAATWDALAFRRELDVPHARLEVVEQDGRVVAFAVWWEVEGELDLLNLVVEGAHRRRGLGRRLMDCLFDEARSRGITRLQLEVRAQTAPALALYRSYGYEVVGRRPGYYADGQDALLLTCELDGR